MPPLDELSAIRRCVFLWKVSKSLIFQVIFALLFCERGDHICTSLHNNSKKRSLDNLDYTTASMAKYWLSEKAHLNISKCLQLFGGWGYMWEYPIARYYADSRAGKIFQTREQTISLTFQV